MKNYEEICKAYTEGSDEFRATVLNLLDEKNREIFLMAVGLYKLSTNEDFYNRAQNAIGQKVYNELRK